MDPASTRIELSRVRRAPRRAIPRSARRARRGVLHPGRIERRAPTAVVVLRQLQVEPLAVHAQCALLRGHVATLLLSDQGVMMLVYGFTPALPAWSWAAASAHPGAYESREAARHRPTPPR